MTVFYKNCPPVWNGFGQINPQFINLQLLMDVLKIVEPSIASTLPERRSGYDNVVFVLFQACVELSQCAPKIMAEWLNKTCKDANYSFQSYSTETFSNNKQRRYFPDQPALSRYLKDLAATGKTEDFWNAVLFAHFLFLSKLGFIDGQLKMIVDVHQEKCKKDKTDPYCFGQKEGKTVYKTLVFSLVSGNMHQVIAIYKLKKGMKRLPLFEAVMNQLTANGFKVTYAMLDREFYRKDLLKAFMHWKITLVMPGRKCDQTDRLIEDYLLGKKGRHGLGSMTPYYRKGAGRTVIKFDLLLAAKYRHKLDRVKRDFKAKKITLEEAKKRVFPLLVLLASDRGIKKVRGNESYIRELYRERWLIEIAFREMNRLGITSHLRGRDGRLGVFGAKALLYNIWQVQVYLAAREDPSAKPLELNEFLGKTISQRYYPYLTPVPATP
jgi:hypothetical protein